MLALASLLVLLQAPAADIGPSVLGLAPAAASRDGRLLAVGCDDGSVHLVDLERRVRHAHLVGHSAPIRRVVFDAGGRRLASADREGVVRVWDLDTHRPTERIEVEGDPGGLWGPGGSVLPLLEFQPGGRCLLVHLSSTTTVWEDETLRLAVDAAFSKGFVRHAAWGPGGELAAGTTEGDLRLWNAELEPAAKMKTARGVRSVDFRYDGKRLAVAEDGLRVTVWDLERLECVQELSLRGHFLATEGDHICTARFSADGRFLVTATTNWWSVGLRDLETGRSRWFHEPLGGNPSWLSAFADDRSQRVYFTGATSGVLDFESGEPLFTAAGPRGQLGATRGGSRIFLRRGDGIEVLDGETLEPLFTYVPCTEGAWRVDAHDR